MRFHQLPTGARFEYQGIRYTKTGPLVATSQASGQPRCLPRAARVTPLEGTPEPLPGAGAGAGAAAAAEDFHQVALGLIDALAEGQGEELRERAREKLAAAYERLRKALEQGEERE